MSHIIDESCYDPTRKPCQVEHGDYNRNQGIFSFTRTKNIHNNVNTLRFWDCLNLIKEIELKYKKKSIYY